MLQETSWLFAGHCKVAAIAEHPSPSVRRGLAIAFRVAAGTHNAEAHVASASAATTAVPFMVTLKAQIYFFADEKIAPCHV